MSAQVAGILLGVFALAVSIAMYFGGFAEQKRANRSFTTRQG